MPEAKKAKEMEALKGDWMMTLTTRYAATIKKTPATGSGTLWGGRSAIKRKHHPLKSSPIPKRTRCIRSPSPKIDQAEHC